MRVLMMALCLVFGLHGSVQAQDEDIRGTISAQIEAFRADDFARAFTFASPNIRTLFGTPENFGGMVRSGYPMVWRPTEVEYLDLRERGGQLWQKVMITDAAGQVHILDYQMIETKNGWKINGVQLLKSAEANV